MPPKYQRALERLKAAGWRVSLRRPQGELPKNIKTRFNWLPQEIIQFISELEVAASSDEKAWLLGCADFCGKGLSAYKWNEWERMSLDAAEGNPELISSIRSFWDDHFPVAISLRCGYAYFAVRKLDFGIACGEEPEFEEPNTVASSFLEFLWLLAERDPKLERWL